MTKAQLEAELKSILNSIKMYPDDMPVMRMQECQMFKLTGLNVWPVNKDGCEVEGDDKVVALCAAVY